MNPLVSFPTNQNPWGLRASSAALIAANVWPLFGVTLLGWSAFELVFVYWCENVILGVINALKMLFCSPNLEEIDDSVFQQLASNRAKGGAEGAKTAAIAEMKRQISQSGGLMHLLKALFVPFFCVHYGGFCFVHGIFVFALLNSDSPFTGGGQGDPFALLQNSLQQLSQTWLLLSLSLLAGSHLFSFVRNYLLGGEYRRTVLPLLMMQPYARVVVLHLAIIAGGFLAAALGSPVWLLVPLVIGKTMLDLKLHRKEHEKLRGASSKAVAG